MKLRVSEGIKDTVRNPEDVHAAYQRAIDEAFSFGAPLVRHLLYGAVHVTMAAGIGVFAVALFRSMGRGGDAHTGA